MRNWLKYLDNSMKNEDYQFFFLQLHVDTQASHREIVCPTDYEIKRETKEIKMFEMH